MTKRYHISLPRDFSRFPGYRYVSQGPNSGEKFRKQLVRALKSHDLIVVDLDGTTGIGSSFLDEAFGGLVFAEGFSPAELRRRIEVRSSLDESYLITVNEAIRRAEKTRMVERTSVSA